MGALLIAVCSGVAFIVAYHTYGRWLGTKIFRLSATTVCPSHRRRDDNDYAPARKSILFGLHFTAITGAGPIVGPAIAVTWGWLPALLWVVFGSIFIGAVHDLGALVASSAARSAVSTAWFPAASAASNSNANRMRGSSPTAAWSPRASSR